MTLRPTLEAAFFAALRAVSPQRLLAPHLGGRRPDLIVAFGKAAEPMARAALEAYGEVPALVVSPPGPLPTLPACAEVLTATHPLPGPGSVRAAEEVLARLAALREGQEVLVLVSGGGSALLCAPAGVTLAQKAALTRDLLRAGADIHDLNAVRKHLSRVKGGRLAAATRAQVRALLLSDVVGDDPAVIASGPTAPDPSTSADALAVLDRYGLDAPEARASLGSGEPETPGVLPHVQNVVVGSNRHLLEAAQAELGARGLRGVILGDTFTGEARDLAGFHAALARSVLAHGTPHAAPVVLVSGGEATVTVRGGGVGGRNQEFALALALALGESPGEERSVTALSVGSDGVDGTSAAAGAWVMPDTLARARALGLDARAFLANNDSGRFFAALGDALETGPTGHNLNDLRLIAVG